MIAKGDGPSDRIRTCGILLPKQARYQLRYTRLFSCFIRLGVFSQMWRGTSSATPGYSVFAIIPRRRRKSKIFLSVVNYVVRADFRPGLVTRRNPASARAARLSGLRLLWSWMLPGPLPNVARYQLRYTRLFSLLFCSAASFMVYLSTLPLCMVTTFRRL